jgi:hypothetical protein
MIGRDPAGSAYLLGGLPFPDWEKNHGYYRPATEDP